MRSLLRFRREDSGMALFVAMSAIALMFLLTTTAFYFASQTLFEAKLADQHDVAFQAASSGVMVAFADLRATPTNGTRTWNGNIVATSTASYAATATYNPSTSPASYDCTSTGTAADGTQEVVVASFQIVPPSSQPLPFGNNVFYFGGADTGSTNGDGLITGPFFILYPEPVPPASFPTYSLNGSMQVNGGPLYVKNGNFKSNKPAFTTTPVFTNGTVNGNSDVGINHSGFVRYPLEATAALTVSPVDLSTYLPTSLANATAQSSDNILGNTTTTVQEVNPIGVPSTYPLSRRGPNVGASGPYKVVSSSVASAGLTIPSAASFGMYPGTAHDDFAYDKSKNTLYVEGTVFVWGTLRINQNIKYVGNGTIVCSGGIVITADVLPSTIRSQPDATHLLCLFSADQVTISRDSGVDFTGAIYAKGPVSLPSNNLTLKGSLLAEGGLINTKESLTITALPLMGAYISPGMPDLMNTSSGSGGANGLRVTAWRRL